MDRGFSAIMIGVGNIGHALIDNFCFSDWGVQLIAAFDVKPEIIGTTFNKVPVLSMEELPGYLDENEIDIVVLTVPKDAAMPVTQILTAHGVEAIWNFTNVELTEPNSSVLVENIHFSDSLLSLSYYISERADERAAQAARRERKG